MKLKIQEDWPGLLSGRQQPSNCSFHPVWLEWIAMCWLVWYLQHTSQWVFSLVLAWWFQNEYNICSFNSIMSPGSSILALCFPCHCYTSAMAKMSLNVHYPTSYYEESVITSSQQENENIQINVYLLYLLFFIGHEGLHWHALTNITW